MRTAFALRKDFMGHDYTYCADMKQDCPGYCPKCQMLYSALESGITIVSWASFRGKEECKRDLGSNS